MMGDDESLKSSSPTNKVAVIMVVHGGYGEALLAAAENLIGSLSVSIVRLESNSNTKEICKKLSTVTKNIDQGKGILFLTDLCGSTPANTCLQLLKEHQGSEMITGLNLAMLIKLSTCDWSLTASILAQELRTTSQRSIQLGTDIIRKGESCGD